MTAEQLRRALRAEPFQPLIIHMADGREIPVKHPEFVGPSPTGRIAAVLYPDDSCEIVDVLLVTSLKLGNGAGKRRRP